MREAGRGNGGSKGLRKLADKPMISHVIARIRPQVHELLISTQAPGEAYIPFGCRLAIDAPLKEPTARDKDAGRIGPLAGILAGLQSAKKPLVLFAPCDMPALPEDLATRLRSALMEKNAQVAVAATAGRAHPVVLMARNQPDVMLHLSRYLGGGNRKAENWHAGLASVTVNFDDQAAAFANINSAEELARYEQSLREK